MKEQPLTVFDDVHFDGFGKDIGPNDTFQTARFFAHGDQCIAETEIKNPYGQPGDLLWVREQWAALANWDMYKPREIVKGSEIHYKTSPLIGGLGKWRTSIHMPRWASRLTLRITNIRVERVQDISEDDAKAEGIHRDSHTEFGEVYQGVLNHSPVSPTAKKAFEDLWNAVNGPDAWDRNDWVWVIEFEVIKQNVDQIGDCNVWREKRRVAERP